MLLRYFVAVVAALTFGAGCTGGGPEVVVDGVYSGPNDLAAPSISLDSIGRVRVARGRDGDVRRHKFSA